jgi:capsid protein
MMNRRDLPECKDPRWWPCHWQGPAKLSIDRNQVASDIAAVDAGLNTLQDYYSARGANWKPKTIQRVQEIKFRMDECAKAGVPYLTVFPAKPGAVPTDAPEDFSGSAPPPPVHQAA